MLDAAEQIAKSDEQLLNAIARRVEVEQRLRPNLDYMQLLVLKETIAELEAHNQRVRP
jgi:hypothetical protein